MANTVAKYQKYAEYKDSGVEWIGNIPEHWTTCSISKLFTIKAGGDIDLKNFSEEHSEEYPYPIYTNANNANSIYGYSRIANYLENSITVSGRGEVGFSVYRDHPFDAIIRLLVLTPQKKCYPKFFAYFINEVINFRVESSAIGQLSTLQISPYKVALPLLDEQKIITHYLDHETTKIDHLIEKQQQLIELLKEKRQAVISHAVTKGLNPNVPMKDSGVEWLGEVPEHWQVGRIKHLAQIITKGTTPTTMGGDFVEEGIRFLKAENIGKGFRVNNYPEFFISEKVDEQLARSRLKEHDVLVIIAGATTGLASVLQKELLPANTNQAVSFIRLLNFNYSHWVSHWLTTQFAQSVIWMGAVQAAQPNLSMESLGNIYIAIPPVEEVIEILKDIEFKLESFESLINKAQQQISLMQERRTALISAAVTGKIDVRNWQSPTVTEAHTELSA